MAISGKLRGFFISIMLLGLAACRLIPAGDSGQPPADVKLGQVLFDCYYVNFAWGYTLSGYFINQDGAIFRYDRGDNRWLPESIREDSFVISSTDLIAKFSNQEYIGEIDPNLLKEKIALIPAVVGGKITEEQVAADAGWGGCVTYRYHPDLDAYSEIPLGAGGDFLIKNNAPEAEELLIWLQDINVAP